MQYNLLILWSTLWVNDQTDDLTNMLSSLQPVLTGTELTRIENSIAANQESTRNAILPDNSFAILAKTTQAQETVLICPISSRILMYILYKLDHQLARSFKWLGLRHPNSVAIHALSLETTTYSTKQKKNETPVWILIFELKVFMKSNTQSVIECQVSSRPVETNTPI